MVGLNGGIDSAILLAIAKMTGLNVTSLSVRAKGFIPENSFKLSEIISRHLRVSQIVEDISEICRAMHLLRPSISGQLIETVSNKLMKLTAKEESALYIGVGASASSSLGRALSFHQFSGFEISKLAEYFGLPDLRIKTVPEDGFEAENNVSLLLSELDKLERAFEEDERESQFSSS